MRVRITMGESTFSLVLLDNSASRSLYEQLPLTLSFSDYNSTEKIAYPPEKLDASDAPNNCDPEVGTLAYYEPWGNLCFFYRDFRHSDGLIPLGQLESGVEYLADAQEDFTLTLKKETTGTFITLTIGTTVLTAEVEDNPAAQAFLDTLPRTLTMNRYSDREYYADIGNFPSEEGVETTFQNGDISYYLPSGSIAFFFAKEGDTVPGGLIRMARLTDDYRVLETLGETIEASIALAN